MTPKMHAEHDLFHQPGIKFKVNSMGFRLWFCIIVCGGMAICAGCEQQYEDLRLTMDDYKITPERLDILSDHRIRLLIRNQGREIHRFHSSILKHPEVTGLEGNLFKKEEIVNGISVHPGKTVEVLLRLSAGQYGFQCPIKGHRGMKGVLIVKNRLPSIVSKE